MIIPPEATKMLSKAAEIALDAKSKAVSAAKEVKTKWDSKTPGEKARFVTTTVVLTMVNPLIPVVWGGVYAAASTAQSKDKEPPSV